MASGLEEEEEQQQQPYYTDALCHTEHTVAADEEEENFALNLFRVLTVCLVDFEDLFQKVLQLHIISLDLAEVNGE